MQHPRTERVKRDQRKYYYKTREERKAYQTKKRTERKWWAVEYLGGACQHCGGVFHHAVYDFHHLDPTIKENHIGKLISGKIEKLKAELDKCILLCANCHRMEHWGKQDAG